MKKKGCAVTQMESIVKTDKRMLAGFIAGCALVGMHLYDKLQNDKLILTAFKTAEEQEDKEA